jgi:hypothetical protein
MTFRGEELDDEGDSRPSFLLAFFSIILYFKSCFQVNAVECRAFKSEAFGCTPWARRARSGLSLCYELFFCFGRWRALN